MSNPVVTLGNYVPEPSDPTVERTSFSRIIYDEQRFFPYGEGEYSPTYAGFDPSGKGRRYFMFVAEDDVLLTVKPDFVSTEAWSSLKRSPSSFVTAVYSVMPKLIVPSNILVDNGILSEDIPSDGKFSSYYFDGADKKDLFNWELVTLNGNPIDKTKYYTYSSLGSQTGWQYPTFRAKDDTEPSNEFVLKLSNPIDPPTGDWLEADSSNLVVDGAFVLVLNVIPDRSASADVGEVSQNPWDIKFSFGDVEMEMSAAGEMRAKITGANAEDSWVTVNLMEGKTKGGPPQQEQFDDKQPYIIMIYPVWNGIIIASGVQESRTSPHLVTPVLASSTFVPKLKDASILNLPWSNGFDPANPAEVEVSVQSGLPDDVTVDFGDDLTVTSKNCRFDLAYLPCFFSKQGWFDEWFLVGDDIAGVVSYEYEVYPIWTANGTAMTLENPVITDSGVPGVLDDTHYDYIQWTLSQTSFNRISGELFGSILQIVETRTLPIRNGNGNFDLAWSGGDAGDPAASSWKDYVQSVSVTTSLDGSNGSVVIDKYGVAGQQALAFQDIGALTLDVDGGFGTVAGSIFQGLAMGISDSKTSSGGTWTIPLVGLEKKLDDIALVNVPFFDAMALGEALDFMSRYAGIIDDQSAANSLTQLSVSTDVNVARFDWKAGTSVRSALVDIMDDVNHEFVVHSGKIFFYELGPTGLPFSSGPDWAGSYPDTKVIMEDQSPDFEDMRNEIVAIGLETITGGEGTKIQDAPATIRVETRQPATNPSFPWARSYVKYMPGHVTQDTLSEFADQLEDKTGNYITIGRTSIPGNAAIKVYDRWDSLYIISVTHNVDLQSKSWTTDLEFAN